MRDFWRIRAKPSFSFFRQKVADFGMYSTVYYAMEIYMTSLIHRNGVDENGAEKMQYPHKGR